MEAGSGWVALAWLSSRPQRSADTVPLLDTWFLKLGPPELHFTAAEGYPQAGQGKDGIHPLRRCLRCSWRMFVIMEHAAAVKRTNTSPPHQGLTQMERAHK